MSKRIRVQICGFRRPEEARAAVEAGADMVAVVLCPARRRVPLPLAAEILSEAPAGVRKVGIFVNPRFEEIAAAVEIAGIEVAQLNGDESPEFCDSLEVEAMKSFRVTDAGVVPDPFAYATPIKHVDAPHVVGGAGIEWDWSRAAELATKFDLVLAGGLNPDNVKRAIEAVSPWGVAVSSGVETDGDKDIGKIHRFVEAAKS
ncbi:MAG: phosphoribosylanthranilate isomerase [Chloroflexi bacterium]|nr:phosphoribosylanthranilate isomerase [Chloroflexota bacterium]MCY3937909.1 phosphoribosylanthranilate isomerase [Chloroflexota bacterium]